jgi:hypothetical protein
MAFSCARRDHTPQGVLRSVERTLFGEVMIAPMKKTDVPSGLPFLCGVRCVRDTPYVGPPRRRTYTALE